MNTKPVVLRRAREEDIEGVVELVNRFAAKNIMLPRTPESVRAALGDFVVAERGNAFVGCATLKVWSDDLAEVRSLAVDPEARMLGIGAMLVDFLVHVAEAQGLKRLFAFTLVPGFFGKLGFEVVRHEALPHKVFNDCANCPKFHACDEVAMVRKLAEWTDADVDPAVLTLLKTRRTQSSLEVRLVEPSQ